MRILKIKLYKSDFPTVVRHSWLSLQIGRRVIGIGHGFRRGLFVSLYGGRLMASRFESPRLFDYEDLF